MPMPISPPPRSLPSSSWCASSTEAREAQRVARLLQQVARSPYLPVEPTLEQAAFLTTTRAEALFAGTAAAGKATAVLLAVLSRLESTDCSGLLVTPQLTGSALLAMTRIWLAGTDAGWEAGARRWRFPSGATLMLSHRRSEPAGVYQVIGVDDLEAFGEEEYLRLLSHLRPSDRKTEPMIRAAASPDGPGREWIARRFGLLDGGGGRAPDDRVVVRASFEDNPHVDAKVIRRAFEGLSEPRRSWLLRGDWSVEASVRGDEPRDSRAGEQEAAATVTMVDHGDRDDRPRALLGTTEGHQLWFDPYLPGCRLENPHLLITGQTGSGKTQGAKAVLAGLREAGITPLVIDFKGDWSASDAFGVDWAGDLDLPVYVPKAGHLQLPFNPLAPPVDEFGEADTQNHADDVTQLLQRIWGLGDQQAQRLTNAIAAVYEEDEVPMGVFRPHGRTVYPTFDDVRRHLDPEDTALSRLARFFRLNLFAASGTGFGTLLERGAVIRLSHLPGDEERGQTKAAVGEFLVRALYHHLVRRPQEPRLRWMLGLDEAWRLGESTALDVLMREGRAFGLGVLLCSQFPRDVPISLRGNTATQVLFAQRLELVADAQRAVLGTTRGQDARRLAANLGHLGDHEAVVANRQLAPWRVVTVRPYFARRSLR